MLAIGIICPLEKPVMTNGGAGVGAPPFVAGIKNVSIPILDSIIDAGITISTGSSSSFFLYLSLRLLYGLALSGNAPSVFKNCCKSGVLYWVVTAAGFFCALAYLNVASSSAVVFNWFVNLTNSSDFISWVFCSIIFLRFPTACEAQDITNLPYKSPVERWGA